jgi:hypothetical protein
MSVVLLKPSPSILVLADAFHCLATGVSLLQDKNLGVTPDLIEAYAVVTVTYAHALRDRISALPGSSAAWPAITDHLLHRLRQARDEDLLLDPREVLDQLAGRLLSLEPLVL